MVTVVPNESAQESRFNVASVGLATAQIAAWAIIAYTVSQVAVVFFPMLVAPLGLLFSVEKVIEIFNLTVNCAAAGFVIYKSALAIKELLTPKPEGEGTVPKWLDEYVEWAKGHIADFANRVGQQVGQQMMQEQGGGVRITTPVTHRVYEEDFSRFD